MLELVPVRDEKDFKPSPQNRISLEFFQNSRRASPSLSFGVPPDHSLLPLPLLIV